ncbi:hypothetical protein [Caenispirillum salinarum]|uniref:hypothetical protein n=1 Tax=Caenispirillum salinarum TaxID=859058 RepID=UPI00384D95A5
MSDCTRTAATTDAPTMVAQPMDNLDVNALRVIVGRTWAENLLDRMNNTCDEDTYFQDNSVHDELLQIAYAGIADWPRSGCHLLLMYNGTVDPEIRRNARRLLHVHPDADIEDEDILESHTAAATHLIDTAVSNWREKRCPAAEGFVAMAVAGVLHRASASSLAQMAFILGLPVPVPVRRVLLHSLKADPKALPAFEKS